MTQSYKATKTVSISATPDRIWEALTDPEQIKHYMFGSEVVSDWVKGAPIVYRGVWEGKPFEDKGIIVDIAPPRLLKTSYYSPLSGKADTPENYSEVTYAITPEGTGSRLTVTQTNLPSQEEADRSESNWGMTLDAIKAMIEG